MRRPEFYFGILGLVLDLVAYLSLYRSGERRKLNGWADTPSTTAMDFLVFLLMVKDSKNDKCDINKHIMDDSEYSEVSEGDSRVPISI